MLSVVLEITKYLSQTERIIASDTEIVIDTGLVADPVDIKSLVLQ